MSSQKTQDVVDSRRIRTTRCGGDAGSPRSRRGPHVDRRCTACGRAGDGRLGDRFAPVIPARGSAGERTSVLSSGVRIGRTPFRPSMYAAKDVPREMRRGLLNCPNCQAQVQPGQRFCPECGARLESGCSILRNAAAGQCQVLPGVRHRDRSSSGAATERAYAPSTPVAERRVVSVLFADLVGFTALAEGRDAEETTRPPRALLRPRA